MGSHSSNKNDKQQHEIHFPTARAAAGFVRSCLAAVQPKRRQCRARSIWAEWFRDPLPIKSRLKFSGHLTLRRRRRERHKLELDEKSGSVSLYFFLTSYTYNLQM